MEKLSKDDFAIRSNPEKFHISFNEFGTGKAKCPPNPGYPDGCHIRFNKQGCIVELPYPAPECGAYTVTCKECNYSCAITSVGRIDDPKSIEMPCKRGENEDARA